MFLIALIAEYFPRSDRDQMLIEASPKVYWYFVAGWVHDVTILPHSSNYTITSTIFVTSSLKVNLLQTFNFV